ncbi:Rap1a/Tai family immunity protein [Xanthomonas sp. WHRI 10064A]|uniref:Rap1a/Tai family immunity protein n=1 Tax=unclassified Xanthomonas TaxID=2643310 RepID=UPI002B22B3F1|nr:MULTISPECIES: Rap1a/Tai family immunity protein [unclassified Xanthomonas]MEA9589250.1 Rap1a/Tai family immunity protein [Xanthomonas sp. WHRI 10064B]MEA9616827.1 Rap1a/Tai family immunity protein [Xanthomonas sp. WHRI 10064A]
MVQLTPHCGAQMLRRLPWLAMAALTVLSTTAAARTLEPWELSGRKLIEAGLDGSLAPEINAPNQPELKVMVSASRAGAYVLGVASTSYRTQWCMPAGKAGPPDLLPIIADITALPDARLDEAAPGLIIEALRKRYPCGKSKK